jgi:hypothetical protein
VQSPLSDVSAQLYARLIGLLVMLLGVGGWWYNWHLLSTEGYFYIKLCLFGPLALGGGLLFMVRPEWTGPWRTDSTRGHKAALISVVAFMAVASGIDMYFLKTHQSPRAVVTSPRRLAVPAPQRAMPSFTPVSLTPSLNFQGRSYRLGSFNQRHNATWEFVTAGETVNDWTRLLTIVDRPDARTREELDRLAEGLMTAYKSNGARVLAAKTLQDDSGAPYNYLVVAFEEPSKQRFELNFVKVTLGATNAVVAIHGARISDSQDYRSKAKEFLDQKSGEVGAALAKMLMPDVSKLPRRTF